VSTRSAVELVFWFLSSKVLILGYRFGVNNSWIAKLHSGCNHLDSQTADQEGD